MNTMNYDTMGACGPVGCAPPAYGYPYGYGAPPPVAPFWGGNVVRTDIIGRQPAVDPPAQVGHLAHWDIIGQNTTPTPAPADQSWLQQPGPLGVKRLWWLVGAGAIGLTWLAYSQGWFGGILGGAHHRRGGDFDDVAGDFFF